MDRFNGWSSGITSELRTETANFIFQFDELHDPHRLRQFTRTSELELVHGCIPYSENAKSISTCQ
jgi:hypothetical protein